MDALRVWDMRQVPGDSGFLLDDGQTAILWDTGFGFTGAAMARALRARLGQRSLDAILLSHSHYDHALGAAYIAREFPGAVTVAGEYAAAVFAKPSACRAMLEMDRKAADRAGRPAAEEARIPAVDRTVRDGDTLTFGSLTLEVLELPGHTNCSLGFWLEDRQLLLSPETLGVWFGRGRCLPSCLVGLSCSLGSFRRARALPVKQLVLPHYGLVTGAEAQMYLPLAEEALRRSAGRILALLEEGLETEAVAGVLEEAEYLPHVAPVYPLDAYRLNTRIMIRRIAREAGFPES